MTGDKQPVLPAFTRRTVRRSVELFSEGNGALSAFALHLKRAGDALVCAEGHEDLGACTAALYAQGGHDGGLFLYEDGALQTQEGESYPLAAAPACVLGFFDAESGQRRLFALTESVLYELNTAGAVATDLEGGSCAAVHYERIFAAKGRTVYYSAPLDPADWTQSLQQAGTLELPEGGDIHAMFSYRDDLYLFRERSITRLFARGDVLDFQAEAIPFSCGRMVRGSVRVCGDEILFLTERGVCSFNGSRVKEIGRSGASLVRPMQATESACCGGRYFCLAELKSGERCIWCVDAADACGHFIRIPAEHIAADGDVFCVVEGRLLQLTARGMPFGGRECLLLCERSMFSLSDAQKFVDSVTVEGAGVFRVEVSAEPHSACAASGRAGERIALAHPVRGNSFCLRIRTFSEDARICKIVLGIREERRTW